MLFDCNKNLIYQRSLVSIVGALLFFTSTLTYAKVGGGISIDSVVSSATTSSKELSILEKKVQIKEFEHNIAVSELFPKIDTSFNLNSIDYDIDGRDPLARINVLGDDLTVFPVSPSTYSSRLDLTLSQTLFSGGRILSKLELAKLFVNRSRLEYDSYLAEKQNEIATLYWSTRLASFEKESADIISDLTKIKVEFLKQTSDRGFLGKKELREAEIDYSNCIENQTLNDSRLIQMKNELIKKGGLSEALVQLKSTPQSLDGMTSFFNTLQDSSGVYDSFSVRKSKLDIAIKKKHSDISKSVFMPEIRLDTGIDYFDSNDTFSKSVDHLKHGNTYIQISVNYNLFSGFKDISTLKKSYLETQISQMTLSSEQEFFDINTNQLIQMCQKSLGEVSRSQKNLESMTVLLDEAYSQFNQNQLSKSDIIETQLHQAELEFLYKKASIEAEISLSNLAFQIGQGLVYLERFKIK